MAIILASEIRAIQATAANSLDLNTPNLEVARSQYKKGPDSITHMEIGDADFPTDVYHMMLGDVGLFKANLVVLLTDLYRWISYAHHRKAENLEQADEYTSVLTTAVGRALSSPEVDYLRGKAGGTLHYAEVYLKVVKRVESLARSALKELAQVRPLRSRYDVDVKIDEVLRESFP